MTHTTFPNVNKELGPEMKSTGEGIYFIDGLKDEFFLKVYSKRNLYLKSVSSHQSLSTTT